MLLDCRKSAGQIGSMTRPSLKPSNKPVGKKIVPAVGFMEVAQLANEQSEIFGPAGIVFACTLVVSVCRDNSQKGL